jgi:predicted nucleotidyltransferase
MGIFQRLLIRIARALESANVPYMVIGGQAVLVHGRPRFTADIDITLGLGIESLEKLRAIADKLSLKPAFKDFERIARQTNVFPVKEQPSNIRVDFIFSFTPYERGAIKRARSIVLGTTNVHYASAEDTIIYKIVAGRPIDIEDVKSIVNLQPDIDKNYIRKWLKAHSDVVARDLAAEYREIERRVSKSLRK